MTAVRGGKPARAADREDSCSLDVGALCAAAGGDSDGEEVEQRPGGQGVSGRQAALRVEPRVGRRLRLPPT